MKARHALLILVAGWPWVAGCGDDACPSLGAHLPRDFAECMAQGFGAISTSDGGRTCTGIWPEGSAAFAECQAAGGGLIADAGEGYLCKLVYPEGACACAGNACD